MLFATGACLLALLATHATAQDPAEGWMAYAVGAIPEKYERITYITMSWKVGAEAKPGFAFYSPWFGMDPADNLNLVQPVNPWGGDGWSMYTEYFQWSPEHNSNSDSYNVKSGQTLKGAIEYLKDQDAYNLTQTIVETGEMSQQIVKCQDGKKFTIPYVVYEKVWSCRHYPPDEEVTFTDISILCDGEDCTKDVDWQAKFKDDNCNFRAHIDSPEKIRITWSTDSASKYDGYTDEELLALNNAKKTPYFKAHLVN